MEDLNTNNNPETNQPTQEPLNKQPVEPITYNTPVQRKKPNIFLATIGVTIVVLAFVYLLAAYVFSMWPFVEKSESETIHDIIMEIQKAEETSEEPEIALEPEEAEEKKKPKLPALPVIDESTDETSEYSVIGEFIDGIARVETAEGNIKYINESYEVIFDKCLLNGDFFNEGKAAVKDCDDNAYHIDVNGERIYQNNFEKVSDFSENLAAVQKDGNWFYIDEGGNRAFDGNFSYAGPFKDGEAQVTSFDGKSQKINTQGKILGNEYLSICPEYEGIRCAVDLSGKQLHIDKNDNPIYEQRYQIARSFSNGRAAVKDFDGNEFHIDTNGNRVYEKNYDEVKDYSEERAVVKEGYGKMYHIDLNGNRLYEKNYDNVTSFKDGAAVVDEGRGGKQYHIGLNGERLYDQSYQTARSFNDGYAAVRLVQQNERWIYIDKEGNPINDQEYVDADDFQNGKAQVAQSEIGSYDIFHIDTDGNRID